MIRVFADLHHGDLWFSLHRLFVERLGWKLYRPIGLDWLHAGYWKIAEPYGNAPDTVNQYLGFPSSAAGPERFDPLTALNAETVRADDDDCYLVMDRTHDYEHRAVTLEQFKALPFDLLVSTYGPPHDESFDRLQRLHQPKAKRLVQMGNWQQTTTGQHVLHSVPYTPRPGQQALHYHQEIDLRAYRPRQSPHATLDGLPTPAIRSFVNCLPFPEIFHEHRKAMPDVHFAAFGAGSPAGSIMGARRIAEMMRQSTLGWHIKPFDGFGHTAMGWMACGRPVITRMQEVQEYGHDAPRLFVPRETCVAIGPDVAENVRLIRRALEPEENARMSEAAVKRFAEVCNYEAEFPRIKAFLEGVLS